MTTDNKKPSLKGSKENIKLSSLVVPFAVSAVFGIVLRFIQMSKFIDPETGFYTGGDTLNIIFYAVLALALVCFCAVSFLSADCKKIETVLNKNKIACVGSRVMAFGFLADSFISFFSGIYNMGTASTGYTDFMKSGAIPLILQSFFALFSAIYFFILGSDFSKGTAKSYNRKIMATAPVCWAGARLIHRFLRQISFIEVSDLFLELIMIAFMVMFFMALAQVTSGVYKDGFKWRITGFGLSAGLIAAVLNLPRLVFTIVDSGLIVSDHPFCLADFTFVIFIITLAFGGSEEKTALVPSAEQEENKD